ncbi:MAG: class I SAM-dependent methyltransferase [Myxococcota bacterium]
MVANLLKQAIFSVHRSQVYEPRNQRVAQGLARQIGQAQSILDVGCGDGSTARMLGELVGATDVRGVEIQIRPDQFIPITPFDGENLPFPDKTFDAVTISDVLHHAGNPGRLLGECVRVARRCVVVKDHFAFGPVSEKLLLVLDMAGNASASVHVRGTYFTPSQWTQMVDQARARIAALEWPFKIHHLPWSILAPSELQFVARLEPLDPVPPVSGANA